MFWRILVKSLYLPVEESFLGQVVKAARLRSTMQLRIEAPREFQFMVVPVFDNSAVVENKYAVHPCNISEAMRDEDDCDSRQKFGNPVEE